MESCYQFNLDEDKTGWIAGWYCSETELDLIVFDRDECPKLKVKPIYYVDDILSFDDFKDLDGYMVYLNDRIITNDVLLTETGQFKIFAKLNDRQTPVLDFQVMGHDMYKVYSDYSFDSEVIGALHDVNSNVYIEHYLLNNDGLELWAKVKMDNQIGYVMMA